MIDICNTWSELTPCNSSFRELAEHFKRGVYEAGGLSAGLREIAPHLHLNALTVNARTLGENIQHAPCRNREVIRPLAEPFSNPGPELPCCAVIWLRTDGAVMFENFEVFKARIDDEALEIDETCVMVLKHRGPRRYPGMTEVGNMPLPPKLLRRGITDMVRIFDARMSAPMAPSSCTPHLEGEGFITTLPGFPDKTSARSRHITLPDNRPD